jgi:hypothetical protein
VNEFKVEADRQVIDRERLVREATARLEVSTTSPTKATLIK